MKPLALGAALLIIAFPLFAQEETLIKGRIESGGFGGPVVKFGMINGETGILVGGRGGWIINHTFIVGGGGYGLANNVRAKTLGPNGERYINFGYGGLELEYIPQSDKLVHLSFMVLIGAGGVGWRDEESGNNSADDAVFVVEPAVHATLNVTEVFRISAGASLRLINGVNYSVTSNASLSGPSVFLTFRFGKF
jgi:hypothetical protein